MKFTKNDAINIETVGVECVFCLCKVAMMTMTVLPLHLNVISNAPRIFKIHIYRIKQWNSFKYSILYMCQPYEVGYKSTFHRIMTFLVCVSSVIHTSFHYGSIQLSAPIRPQTNNNQATLEVQHRFVYLYSFELLLIFAPITHSQLVIYIEFISFLSCINWQLGTNKIKIACFNISLIKLLLFK